VTLEAAPVNPKMLRWARQSAGYSIEEAAARLHVSTATVTKMETGEHPVTFGRVDDLSGLYKRPSVVFYLPDPPQEDETFPADFRSATRARTPSVILQVRRAKERRTTALEIATSIGEQPRLLGFECSTGEDPEVVGARLRKRLGFAEPADGWADDTTGYASLGTRKRAVENAGVLVFQAPGADFEEVSGLSMHFDRFPVVILRASDSTRRRSFTLFHELAHLGLRQGGLCDLHDDGVELFCNRVAAAAMMPAQSVEAAEAREGLTGQPTATQLGRLAATFGVSEQAMLLRLVGLGVVPLAVYMARRSSFVRKDREAPAASKGGTHYRNVLARNGDRYTHLVLEGYARGILTGHRAATYLGTSVTGLERVGEDLARKTLRAAS